MLSRVANSIYWLSRYVERAESVARFLEVNFHLSLGKGGPISEQWAPLVCVSGDVEEFYKSYEVATREDVVQFFAFDRSNPNSIASCVERARENAREIREVLPIAIWEQLNKFYLLVQSPTGIAEINELTAFCEQVKLASHVFNGMTESTMLHGEEWHFTQLGRLIERADKISRIVDVQYFILLPQPDDVGTALDLVRWSSLLKSNTALSTYRRLHGGIAPVKVADFLLLNRLFPRSIHYCLIHAQASLQAITGSAAGTFACRSEQELGRIRSEFDYLRIEDVIASGMHEFVEDFQLRLNNVGHAIHSDFFTPRGVFEKPLQPHFQRRGQHAYSR